MQTGKDRAAEQRGASLIGRTIRAIPRYVDSPNPIVRANNVLALMVASNQPFYPFYVRFVAGDDNGVTFLTLLSTPFFLAIPLLARWRPAIALAAIPVLGIANGMLAMKALGTQAGIELFVIPCFLVALLVSYKNTWKMPVSLAVVSGLSFGLQFLLQEASLHAFDAPQYSSLYRLNAFSVLGLTAFIVYSLGRARLAGARIMT